MCFFDTDSLSLAIIRAKILPHKFGPHFPKAVQPVKKWRQMLGRCQILPRNVQETQINCKFVVCI